MAQQTDYLSASKDFSMLSIRDLLEARDQYHIHLMHKENVIATAVGRYLIRKSDRDSDANGKRSENKPARTLANSEVRKYSWPCILVFVKKWEPADEFGCKGKLKNEDYVPKTLYLADGRTVPVCVVEAPLQEYRDQDVPEMIFPDNKMGGGYPVKIENQGQTHFASIGCLVSDGHTIYGMSNRHVCGKPGEEISTLLRGKKTRIGKTADKQLTRMLFEEVYGGWPGKKTYVNLDIGLVELDDLNMWSAQVYGIGPMGEVADLSSENISLKLIDCPVVAYGCASGKMTGAIKALFYRYESMGGFEHVADFLIGPRHEGEFATHHGDSGTLWLLDQGKKNEPRPIAIQWGGHVVLDSKGKSQSSYALATCLSTVCNLLNVEVIRDWNLDLPEYWGAVGHYTMATSALGFIKNKKLKQLMNANLTDISFQTCDISEDSEKLKLKGKAFVPVADVPDYVWKNSPYQRGSESPNHFADMDEKVGGKDLLTICKKPSGVDPDVWLKYDKAIGGDASDWGLLPFRVWQIYDNMVEFLSGGDVKSFVCAAGCLSHYVGDCCQPLHVSCYHDGDESRKGDDSNSVNPGKDKNGKPKPRYFGMGVHEAYEKSMVGAYAPDIYDGISRQTGTDFGFRPIGNGKEAGIAAVALMRSAIEAIPPIEIVEAFAAIPRKSSKGMCKSLWEHVLPGGKTIGDQTIKVMAMGTALLAHLWDSAWAAAKADKSVKELGVIKPELLRDLYVDKAFLHSYNLVEIAQVLAKRA